MKTSEIAKLCTSPGGRILATLLSTLSGRIHFAAAREDEN